eukprot:scaffold204311_cov58-Attheya_sp.AAC.1
MDVTTSGSVMEVNSIFGGSCNVHNPPTYTRTAQTLTHATHRHCMPPPPPHNNLPERCRYHQDTMSRRSAWIGHGEHALYMESCQGHGTDAYGFPAHVVLPLLPHAPSWWSILCGNVTLSRG